MLTATLDDDKLVNFECGITDVLCGFWETTGNGMAESINWFSATMLGSQGFEPESSLWETAVDQAGIWLGFSAIVMLITSVVGFGTAAVTGRSDLFIRVIAGTLLAFPATLFAFFFVGEGLRVMDAISEGLILRIGGQEGFAAFIEAAFKGKAASGFLATMSSPGGQLAVRLIVLVVMFLGVALIAVAMAFRNFVLMLLVAFAPLGFVLLPMRGGGVWVQRWLSAVVAMALAKPLTLGTLSLILSGFGDLESLWSFEGFTLGIGLILASFMPLLVYSFFNFVGSSGGQDQIGSQAGRAASGTAQRFAPRRFGRPGGGGGGGSASKPSSAAPKAPTQVGKSGSTGKAGTSSNSTSGSGAGKAKRPGAGVGAQDTFTPKPAPSAPKVGKSGS